MRQLERCKFGLIDCQVYTAHLERFGAHSMPRLEYLQNVRALTAAPGKEGPWAFDADLDPLTASPRSGGGG